MLIIIPIIIRIKNHSGDNSSNHINTKYNNSNKTDSDNDNTYNMLHSMSRRLQESNFLDCACLDNFGWPVNSKWACLRHAKH